MHTNRLEIIAEICDLIDSSKFDMAFHLNYVGIGDAIGHAALDSRIAKQGFFLKETDFGHYPIYYSVDSFNAIEAFLNLSQQATHNLFGKHLYLDQMNNPKLVARAIRFFINSRGQTAKESWHNEIDQLEAGLKPEKEIRQALGIN